MHASRSPATRSLWLVALLALAACSAPPPPSPTLSPSPVPPTPTATRSPTLAPSPTPTPTPFVPRATIKIAIHGPRTGQFASAWSGLIHAAQLADDAYAPSLQDAGFKLQLAYYDDEADINVAARNAKDIIDDPEILCGVGHYNSRVFYQTQQIYHPAGLAFIGPSTTAAMVTLYGYAEVNRLAGRDDLQGGVAAAFAESMAIRRAFVVSQTNDYSRLNAYEFRTEAAERGIEIAGTVRTDASSGFRPSIDAAMAAEADVIYFSTVSSDQAGKFLKEARAAGFRGMFLGPDGIGNPGLLTAAGPRAVDGAGVYFTAVAAEPRFYAGAVDFVSEYTARFAVAPAVFSAEAYDAVGICVTAILNASLDRGGEVPTRAEVAAAIRALQGYRGITGSITFNGIGEPNPGHYYVFRVLSADPDDWDDNALVASLDLAPPE